MVQALSSNLGKNVMGVRFGFLKYLLFTAVMVPAGAAISAQAHDFGRGIESTAPQAYIVVAAGSEVAAEGARTFIQNMAGKAIGFLGDSSMTAEGKKQAFRKLLQDSFDMKTIGRFSLGRYWRVATPEQRKEYQALFESMVINVYSQRFSEYKGQKFEARSFRSESENDTLVTSFIIPAEGPEIQVDWRVRHKNGNYKVVDIIVEGVSMSVTQRSDFSSVIQRGGGDVKVLLDHLRTQSR